MKISDEYPDLLTADGLDEAVIGIAHRIGLEVICYDLHKVISILMTRDGMDEDEAYEFYQFNIAGAWVGESTPLFLQRMEK